MDASRLTEPSAPWYKKHNGARNCKLLDTRPWDTWQGHLTGDTGRLELVLFPELENKSCIPQSTEHK